jgi:hypothetical protein
VFSHQRERAVEHLAIVELANPVELDELHVGQELGPIITEAEDPRVVVAAELVVARVVEIPEPSIRAIEHVRHDRGLDVIELVRDARGIGKVEGVDLGRQQPAHLELFLDVVLQAAPRVHLGDIDPVERPQILGRELEELPLVALEVDGERERQRGPVVETQRVQQLDPEVDVAVGLGPYAVA